MHSNSNLEMLGGRLRGLIGNAGQQVSMGNISSLQQLATEQLSEHSESVTEFQNIEVASTRHAKQALAVSDEGTDVMIVYINVINIGCIVTSLGGVIGNAINMAVYRKQGLKDSITLGLFALSVSDFVLVCMPLFRGFLMLAKLEFPDSSVDFTAIHYVSSSWAHRSFFSTSCLITTFVSLERCCCIVLPFKVQRIFTRKKTTVFLCVMATVHLVGLFCIPLVEQLRWREVVTNADESRNSSRSSRSLVLQVWFLENADMIELFYTITLSFVVPVGTQAIVTVCGFVMVRGLQKSSQFRARTKTRTTPVVAIKATPPVVAIKAKPPNNTNESSSSSSTGGVQVQTTPLSPRDARLVKAIIFLVIIFSACNVPFLVVTFAWRLIPELSVHGIYRRILTIMFSSIYVTGNLNASANIFVYYKSSSRFREVFREIFCKAPK